MDGIDGKTSGDHPRLCGEKHSAVRCTVSRKGSPPPMRGKEKWAAEKPVAERITPAYAGKSGVLWIHDDLNLDHPRLCGEKRNSQTPEKFKERITPAYAGKRNGHEQN